MTGVIVGMVDERRCLDGLGRAVRVGCSGARPAEAEAQAEALAAAGVTALLSFGLAGALIPGLAPGALLLPEAVVLAGSGETVAVTAGWHARVASLAAAAGLPMITTGVIAGSDQPLVTAAAKAALARTRRAVAVDMESHRVAAVARRFGLPWLVVRAVADPAGRGIPELALAGLGPDGETRPWAVAGRLVLAPWQLPGLLRLAADSRAGLAALTGAVGRLGPAAFLVG